MTWVNLRGKLHAVVLRLQRLLSRDEFDDLREFIYLDEISVRSLLASTGEGGIVSETVDEQMRRSRSGGSVGGSVSGGSASLNSQISSEHEKQETKIETRNYDLIQSKFTKLYKSEVVEKKLSLNQIPEKDEAPDEKFSSLAVSELDRGDVIELRVNVEANLLFRLYQTIDYFADSFDEQIDSDTEEILDLIETSLGNQIPVIGEAVDYRVVDGDEKEIKRCTDLDEEEEDDIEDLKVVTLLNLDSLWVDPIQSLFSEDGFVVYCRVEDVDIDSWYPLKVTRAIDSISESAAQEINRQFRQGLNEVRNEISNSKGFSDWSENSIAQWDQDIVQYTEALEDEYGLNISDDDQEQLLEEAAEAVDVDYELSETAQRKEFLNVYTDAFVDLFGVDSIDQEERQKLRPEPSNSSQMDGMEELGNEEDGFKIEAKTVAMYW